MNMFGSRYQKIGLPHAVQLSQGLLGVPVVRFLGYQSVMKALIRGFLRSIIGFSAFLKEGILPVNRESIKSVEIGIGERSSS